jgi:mRNA-degrading endonuclease RelE of RelBE toxin-antitoxin system
MKYQIAKRFKKDLDKIHNPKILTKVRRCIEAIGKSQLISEIPDLEALKGFSGYYRIKFDYSYRIGIFL